MIPLIIGAVTTIVVLSVVSYVLYSKFQKIDSSQGGNTKVFQELRVTDEELRKQDVKIFKSIADTNAYVKTEDEQLLASIDKTNKTHAADLSKSTDLINQNVKNLQSMNSNLTANINKNMTTVSSEFKYTKGEFATVNNLITKNMGIVRSEYDKVRSEYGTVKSELGKLRDYDKTLTDTVTKNRNSAISENKQLNDLISKNKKFVDNEFALVDSELETVQGELANVITEQEESHKMFNTDVLFANGGIFGELTWAPWASYGQVFSDSLYGTKLGTSGMSVYKNLWDNTQAKVYNMDNAGNSWQAGTLKAPTVDVENGSMRVFKNKNPDLGVGVFSTGQTGNSWANYNGGIESTNGIGFRNKPSNNTTFLHDTKTGNTFLKGELNANRYLVSMSNNGALLEQNMGASNDRYGIGYSANQLRMYSGSKVPTGMSLSKVKLDGTYDDILTINTSNNVNIQNDMTVGGLLSSKRVNVDNDLYVTGQTNMNNSLIVNGTIGSTGGISTKGNMTTTLGNMGVGTSNPSTKLHVIGGTLFTGGSSSFEHDITGKPNMKFALDGTTTGNRFVVQNQTAGGNVGIGTATPSSKLHVVGNTLFTGGSSVFDHNITGKSGAEFALDGASAGSRFVVKTGGNVGIGTATPSSKLHVVGGAYVSGGTSKFDSDITVNQANKFSLDGTSPGSRFVVQNQTAGGNVGIGIAVPTSKLHVSGNGLFTGNVTSQQLCLGTTCVTEETLKKINALP